MLLTALPARVAGVLQVDSTLDAQWTVAGAWRMPVGAPELLGVPGAPDEPAFQVNRGVERSGKHVTHQGVDLVNGRSGDPVRAAASGLVVLALNSDNGSGYGGHVVIAHKLEDGNTVYTVYAHLRGGSVVVHAGDLVCAGDPLGRVGQTGRASTPHLHFEVREPEDLEERWEKVPVVDPLAFVLDHAGPPLPGPVDDDSPRAYLRWAEGERLLLHSADPAAALTRGTWWRMMSRAVPGGHGRAAKGAEALRDSLMAAGVLPAEEGGAPAQEHIAWAELARDVERLSELGVRMPHGPLAAADHEAACKARFGQRAPASHPHQLRHRDGEPELADATMLLADLSGPLSEPLLARSARSTHAAPAALHHRTKHHRAKHPVVKTLAKKRPRRVVRAKPHPPGA